MRAKMAITNDPPTRMEPPSADKKGTAGEIMP
jgi:hypothetical protein